LVVNQTPEKAIPSFTLAEAAPLGEDQFGRGKSWLLASGLSLLIPGAGQVYNQDYIFGGVYVLGAIGLTVATLATSESLFAQIGLPAVSFASAIHAGLQTQEVTLLRF